MDINKSLNLKSNISIDNIYNKDKYLEALKEHPYSDYNHNHFSEKSDLILNTDDYWLKIWEKIDSAKNYVFIVIYAMDNNFNANYTLQKLSE